MWEEAQIKANVGLKHWSRLWLTQNKYINHWNLLRLSLDPSWSVSLWLQRTYFQADWMHVCQTELFSWHFRDVRFSPSSDTVCYPRDSGYMFTPALWRKQRCSFLHWWMWVLTNILWQKRLKQCMILLTANRYVRAHTHTQSRGDTI